MNLSIENNEKSSLDQLVALKLFIVDDEPFNVALLERMLLKAGFTNFFSSTDSSTAVAVCTAQKPDLLLLDLRMPDVDGFQIMDELNLDIEMRNIPVLVLTAENSTENRLRALNAGAKDFITKPFDRSEVITRIKNILETQQLYIQLQNQNTDLDQLVQVRTNELHAEQSRLEDLNNSLESIVEVRTNDLKSANNELEKTNQTMSELVSIVSHELRTPLTSIKSFAEILRDEADNLDQDSKSKFLSIIDEESDRLSRLISDLLDLQKISSGKMAWKTDVVDLASLSKKIVEFFTPAYTDKGLQLNLSLNLEKALVFTDSDKCRQVLTNLLSNALKFSEQGSIDVKIDHTENWANIILVSEDNESVNVLTSIISSLQAKILHFTSHEKATIHLDKCGGKVDMMIIDIACAKSKSLKPLEEIRDKYPSLPLTAIYSPDQNRELVELKSSDQKRFIQKPIVADRDNEIIELLISDLIGIDPRTKMISVSVADNGIGIPENDLNKVFKRFHQVDSSQIREQSGTGLGLTITKEIVEHYQGKIWVESKSGKGSTFTFLIPEWQKEKKKLGEILIEKGILTEKQVNDALNNQE